MCHREARKVQPRLGSSGFSRSMGHGPFSAPKSNALLLALRNLCLYTHVLPVPSAAGSHRPMPCPAGTFSSLPKQTLSSACQDCPPGFFCKEAGLQSPSGQCPAGERREDLDNGKEKTDEGLRASLWVLDSGVWPQWALVAGDYIRTMCCEEGQLFLLSVLYSCQAITVTPVPGPSRTSACTHVLKGITAPWAQPRPYTTAAQLALLELGRG